MVILDEGGLTLVPFLSSVPRGRSGTFQLHSSESGLILCSWVPEFWNLCSLETRHTTYSFEKWIFLSIDLLTFILNNIYANECNRTFED